MSNILLYFSLEAKHTKFGDPNLITLDFGLFGLKKPKNASKKAKKYEKKIFLQIFCLILPWRLNKPNLVVLTSYLQLIVFWSPKILKSPKKPPKKPKNHPDAPILQLEALGCDNYI